MQIQNQESILKQRKIQLYANFDKLNKKIHQYNEDKLKFDEEKKEMEKYMLEKEAIYNRKITELFETDMLEEYKQVELKSLELPEFPTSDDPEVQIILNKVQKSDKPTEEVIKEYKRMSKHVLKIEQYMQYLTEKLNYQLFGV